MRALPALDSRTPATGRAGRTIADRQARSCLRGLRNDRPAIRRGGSGKLSTHWCIAARRCVPMICVRSCCSASGRRPGRRRRIEEPGRAGAAVSRGQLPQHVRAGRVRGGRETADEPEPASHPLSGRSRRAVVRGRSSTLEELLVVVGGYDDYRGSQQTGGVEVHEDPCDGVLGPVDRRTHTGSGVHASRLREAANPPRPAGLPRDAGGGT